MMMMMNDKAVLSTHMAVEVLLRHEILARANNIMDESANITDIIVRGISNPPQFKSAPPPPPPAAPAPAKRRGFLAGALLNKAKKIQSGEESNPLANFDEDAAPAAPAPARGLYVPPPPPPARGLYVPPPPPPARGLYVPPPPPPARGLYVPPPPPPARGLYVPPPPPPPARGLYVPPPPPPPARGLYVPPPPPPPPLPVPAATPPPAKRRGFLAGALLNKAKKIQSGEDANPLANFDEDAVAPPAAAPAASVPVASTKTAPTIHRADIALMRSMYLVEFFSRKEADARLLITRDYRSSMQRLLVGIWLDQTERIVVPPQDDAANPNGEYRWRSGTTRRTAEEIREANKRESQPLLRNRMLLAVREGLQRAFAVDVFVVQHEARGRVLLCAEEMEVLQQSVMRLWKGKAQTAAAAVAAARAGHSPDSLLFSSHANALLAPQLPSPQRLLRSESPEACSRGGTTAASHSGPRASSIRAPVDKQQQQQQQQSKAPLLVTGTNYRELKLLNSLLTRSRLMSGALYERAQRIVTMDIPARREMLLGLLYAHQTASSSSLTTAPSSSSPKSSSSSTTNSRVRSMSRSDRGRSSNNEEDAEQQNQQQRRRSSTQLDAACSADDTSHFSEQQMLALAIQQERLWAVTVIQHLLRGRLRFNREVLPAVAQQKQKRYAAVFASSFASSALQASFERDLLRRRKEKNEQQQSDVMKKSSNTNISSSSSNNLSTEELTKFSAVSDAQRALDKRVYAVMSEQNWAAYLIGQAARAKLARSRGAATSALTAMASCSSMERDLVKKRHHDEIPLQTRASDALALACVLDGAIAEETMRLHSPLLAIESFREHAKLSHLIRERRLHKEREREMEKRMGPMAVLQEQMQDEGRHRQKRDSLKQQQLDGPTLNDSSGSGVLAHASSAVFFSAKNNEVGGGGGRISQAEIDKTKSDRIWDSYNEKATYRYRFLFGLHALYDTIRQHRPKSSIGLILGGHDSAVAPRWPATFRECINSSDISLSGAALRGLAPTQQMLSFRQLEADVRRQDAERAELAARRQAPPPTSKVRLIRERRQYAARQDEAWRQLVDAEGEFQHVEEERHRELRQQIQERMQLQREQRRQQQQLEQRGYGAVSSGSNFSAQHLLQRQHLQFQEQLHLQRQQEHNEMLLLGSSQQQQQEQQQEEDEYQQQQQQQRQESAPQSPGTNRTSSAGGSSSWGDGAEEIVWSAAEHYGDQQQQQQQPPLPNRYDLPNAAASLSSPTSPEPGQQQQQHMMQSMTMSSLQMTSSTASPQHPEQQQHSRARTNSPERTLRHNLQLLSRKHEAEKLQKQQQQQSSSSSSPLPELVHSPTHHTALLSNTAVPHYATDKAPSTLEDMLRRKQVDPVTVMDTLRQADLRVAARFHVAREEIALHLKRFGLTLGERANLRKRHVAVGNSNNSRSTSPLSKQRATQQQQPISPNQQLPQMIEEQPQQQEEQQQQQPSSPASEITIKKPPPKIADKKKRKRAGASRSRDLCFEFDADGDGEMVGEAAF